MDIPPLRSYKESLPVMASVFLYELARRHERPARRLSPEADALLMTYAFPGNVRELKNVMEHAVIMAQGEEITPEDLPGTITEREENPSEAWNLPADPLPAAPLEPSPSPTQAAPLPAAPLLPSPPPRAQPTDSASGREADSPEALPSESLRELREKWLAPLETRYLTDLLAACRGNVRLASRRAGVDPVTMYRLLERRGLGRSRSPGPKD